MRRRGSTRASVTLCCWAKERNLFPRISDLAHFSNYVALKDREPIFSKNSARLSRSTRRLFSACYIIYSIATYKHKRGISRLICWNETYLLRCWGCLLLSWVELAAFGLRTELVLWALLTSIIELALSASLWSLLLRSTFLVATWGCFWLAWCALVRLTFRFFEMFCLHTGNLLMLRLNLLWDWNDLL